MLEMDRIDAALAGDPRAVHELVVALTPVVQARVARMLLRRGLVQGRNARQEVEDLTQDVFMSLFADDQKILRSWKPHLGLSLQNFVGLVAQRRVASVLRTHKRTPWFEEPVSDVESEIPSAIDCVLEGALHSRQLLERLLDRLEDSLTERGHVLFVRLYVQQESVEDVCAALDITANAVHQWRFRLAAAARAALEELERERDTPTDVEHGLTPIPTQPQSWRSRA